MSKYILLLSLAFNILNCLAQRVGNIFSNTDKPRVSKNNIFYYTPPSRLALPDTLNAIIAYTGENGNAYQITPVVKCDNYKYKFEFTPSRHSSALVIAIADFKKHSQWRINYLLPNIPLIIDNNNRKGFIIKLYDSSNKPIPTYGISMAILLNGFTQQILDIKPISPSKRIEYFHETYQKWSIYKYKDEFEDYLKCLYEKKYPATKKKILNYVNDISRKSDEKSLITLIKCYELLGMKDKIKAIEKTLLCNFPNGQYSKEVFWQEYYQNPPTNVLEGLKRINDYKEKFGTKDTTDIDALYMRLISIIIDVGSISEIVEYETKINNKKSLAFLFYKIANRLIGNIDDSAKDRISNIEMLSKKSLEILFATKCKVDTYENMRCMFLETYALIKYKLQQFDSALAYQQYIISNFGKQDIKLLERCVMYSEKAKGILFTKQMIESALEEGSFSIELEKLLKKIYQQLNISEDSLFTKKRCIYLSELKKRQEDISKKIKTVKAFFISLKGMNGKTVRRSNLKNKIVVIDFWSSWCLPCKNTFPEMQKLIEYYQIDSNIVFLFIDVWEKEYSLASKHKIAEFMNKNNFSFTVLFDERETLVKKYHIESIPSSIVINTRGEIVYYKNGGSSAELKAVIEAERLWGRGKAKN